MTGGTYPLSSRVSEANVGIYRSAPVASVGDQ
jgi:hypothetical protein